MSIALSTDSSQINNGIPHYDNSHPTEGLTRTEKIDYLLELGLVPLPVAPKQDPKEYHKEILRSDPKEKLWSHCPITQDFKPLPLFTGKNPSFLDRHGRPHMLNHGSYAATPREELVDLIPHWFTHTNTGIGTLGNNAIVPIDFDVKQFGSQENCDCQLDEWFNNHPELRATWIERTQSMGYRVIVKVKQPPTFTNFALSEGGPHVGEVIVLGRFTVLAPTIGPSGKPYVEVQCSEIVEVESLRSIGIYPTRKEHTRAYSRQSEPSFNHSGVSIADLVNKRTSQLLQGKETGGNPSDILTKAVAELQGWENWLADHRVPIECPAEFLMEQAAIQLDRQYKLERVIKSVDDRIGLESCQPSIHHTSGDEACWKKLKDAAPQLWEIHVPEEYRGDSKEEREPNKSQADLLVELANSAQIEFFHTSSGEAYADVWEQGVRATYKLRNSGFKYWIKREFYLKFKKAVGSQALHDALGVLEGRAIHEGLEREVHLRVAEENGTIYIDSGDATWQSIVISADRWSLAKESPVRFRRDPSALPLPIPQRGGDIREIQELLTVDQKDFPLVMAWLLFSYFAKYSHPILMLAGEQGSGKSTSAFILKSLVDPSKAALLSSIRDERNLMIAAKNSWILAFDNLSHISNDLSDALCRLATGTGFRTRKLQTDDEETVIEAMRPMIFTGIEELGTKSDLLDRMIVVTCVKPTQPTILSEAKLEAKIEELRPLLLGCLLDALVQALAKVKDTKYRGGGRMIQFAEFAIAGESKLGLEPGSIEAAYEGNREQIHETAIEGSPVAQVVLSFMEDKPVWMGKASELLKCLKPLAIISGFHDKHFPHLPKTLSASLRRSLPNLRAVGLEVSFDRSKHERTIKLERACNFASPASPKPSQSSESTNRKGSSGDAEQNSLRHLYVTNNNFASPFASPDQEGDAN